MLNGKSLVKVIPLVSLLIGSSALAVPSVRLEPGTWVCLNNPNPACENLPGIFERTDRLIDEDHWNCVNNVNSGCNNPKTPHQRYRSENNQLEPNAWSCINNPAAACKNPPAFEIVR